MIKVFEPKLTIFDKLSVMSSLQKNYISGTSPSIEKFENTLGQQFNRKYAVAVSNGSVALDVSIKLLNLPKGSEIIVPSFTIISCLSAVMRAGLKPIFCDVNSDTWNMTLENVKKVFTPNTKALLMVHTYGLPCEVQEILKFCNDENIRIVEDAAEAHGLKIDEVLCGTIGEVSTFSFYANKHITTGEGGAILTDSEEHYKNLKKMINLDFSEPQRFNHDNFYWNYRMSGLQAALGISQTNSLQKTINFKKDQGSFYTSLLKSLEGSIQTPLEKINNTENNYWVYGIVLNENISRLDICNYLYKNKIETREFFWPLHLQNAYIKNKKDIPSLPISEKLGRQGFYIPMGRHINKSKQKFIVQKIKEAVNITA